MHAAQSSLWLVIGGLLSEIPNRQDAIVQLSSITTPQTNQDRTKQDKAQRSNTTQGKAKQNKTRQNKQVGCLAAGAATAQCWMLEATAVSVASWTTVGCAMGMAPPANSMWLSQLRHGQLFKPLPFAVGADHQCQTLVPTNHLCFKADFNRAQSATEADQQQSA